MERILVLGAGFAGLWAAVGAARKLAECGPTTSAVEILVVNARPFHSIRVRNYELDGAGTAIPLAEVLDPIGVRWIEARVTDIDVDQHCVTLVNGKAEQRLTYARLVMALGSTLARPPLPGLKEYGFDVDTCEGADKLYRHLQALPKLTPSPGRYTAAVIGAGLTGAEITAELPSRLAAVAREDEPVRVILMDHSPRIAHALGEAQPVIAKAMQALHVELRPGVKVIRISDAGVTLESGEQIPAATVVWCAGMHATALTAKFPVEHDALGRLPVDDCLRVRGVPDVYAAGDCATFPIDGQNPPMMSCQYSRPMGRYAGYNVAAELLGEAPKPLRIDWYTTIVDLGPWGAVYTRGRERRLVAEGARAKRTKRLINCERIVPPRSGKREEILRAAAPEVQAPPPENVAAPA